MRLPFQFLDASNVSDYNNLFSTNFTTSKHAIWYSHIRAYEKLLNSDDNWVLIFEDDIDFNSKFVSLKFLSKRLKSIEKLSPHISLIQLGFNYEAALSYREYISNAFYFLFRFRRYDFKNLVELETRLGFTKLFRSSMLISNRWRFSFLVKGHLRGTHYYVINRKLAEYTAKYFYENSRNHSVPAIDMFFNALADETHTHLILRPSRTFAQQSASKSDNKY